MNRLWLLCKRDFGNSINKKFFLLLGFMVLFQSWFIAGSGSIHKVAQQGGFDYMAIVFSFNFLGPLAALALTFDGVSRERQNKVLDLLLTARVTKGQVIGSKTLSNLAVSLAFSAAYVLAIAAIFALCGGGMAAGRCLRFIPALTAFNFIYCMLGLMLSIIFRSSKTSFIVSMIVGLLCMPRLIVSVLDSIATAFHLGEGFTRLASMTSPALIMNAIGDPTQGNLLGVGLGFLALYIAGMLLFSMITFRRQDEMNYGE